MKRLYLSESNRKIAGVCGGLGEYFDKDATIFRVLFILLTVLSYGAGIIGYLLMWLIIPKKPKAK
ncbi:MAG: PspC domain-containing protein [Candidatus Omnitrophica bacterium]|nr:PspC domain-containing protein [Candidatus Omnitrophota bacterium]